MELIKLEKYEKKYVYILISYYIITKRFKYDSVIFIIISLKKNNKF